MLDHNRAEYPHQSNQTIDWEKVFNDPKEGLITMLARANNEATLLKIFEVILGFLFIRDGDSAIRERHLSELKMFVDDENKSFEGSLSLAQNILNMIKDDRIEIARNYVPDAEDVEPVEERELTSSELLEEIIISDYRHTLQTIAIREYDQSLGKLPFILSSTFHELFFTEFKKFCLKPLASECEVFADENPRYGKDFEEVLDKKTLLDLNFREKVWDIWRQVWSSSLKERRLPKKPTAPSGVSAVGDMFTKKHEKEQVKWKETNKKAKRHNQKIKNFYEALCAQNEDYEAPTREEVSLMVKTFGMTRNVFEKHTSGIEQIIVQNSENRVATFAAFAEKRNIDISLLYMMFFKPKYVTGDENYLKLFMRCFKGGQIQSHFPYTHKYLNQFMT